MLLILQPKIGVWPNIRGKAKPTYGGGYNFCIGGDDSCEFGCISNYTTVWSKALRLVLLVFPTCPLVLPFNILTENLELIYKYNHI